MNEFFKGFLIGLSCIMPLGAQNLFVMQSSFHLPLKKVIRIIILVIIMDLSLATTAFLGFSSLMYLFPKLELFMYIAGACTILMLSIATIRNKVIDVEKKGYAVNNSFFSTVFSVFAVTWLNPQALIDSALLIGTGTAQYGNNFFPGICLASVVWFLLLGLGSYYFQRFFSAAIIKMINLLSAGILFFYGMKLLSKAFLLIK